MSLDYNLTKIKNREVNFPPNTESVAVLGTLNLKVHAAIWACIPVQIGEITQANADEWYDRYVFSNRLMGTTDPANDLPLSREDVHNLVGLSTNVWPHLSRRDWLDRQFQFSQEGRF